MKTINSIAQAMTTGMARGQEYQAISGAKFNFRSQQSPRLGNVLHSIVPFCMFLGVTATELRVVGQNQPLVVGRKEPVVENSIIHIKGGKQWYALDEFEIASRAYLRKSKRDFDMKGMKSSFEINPSSRRQFVVIFYSQGFAKPYCRVLLNKDCKVTGFQNGILEEGPLSKRS
jgi:hypothetical protein